MLEGLTNSEIKDWVVKLQWEIATHKVLVDSSEEIINELVILSGVRRLNHQTLTSEEAERLNKAKSRFYYHDKARIKKQQLLLEIRQERTNMIAIMQQIQFYG